LRRSPLTFGLHTESLTTYPRHRVFHMPVQVARLRSRFIFRNMGGPFRVALWTTRRGAPPWLHFFPNPGGYTPLEEMMDILAISPLCSTSLSLFLLFFHRYPPLFLSPPSPPPPLPFWVCLPPFGLFPDPSICISSPSPLVVSLIPGELDSLTLDESCGFRGCCRKGCALCLTWA